MKHSESHMATERLWLREIDESDAHTIVSLRSNPKVYRFFENPCAVTIPGHRKWYWENYVPNQQRIDWMAIDNETGKVVGVYGAKYISGHIMLSYLTSADMQGNGYAREAVERIMRWGLEYWKSNHFFAVIHKDNFASIHFIEQLLFFRERTNEKFLIYKRSM